MTSIKSILILLTAGIFLFASCGHYEKKRIPSSFPPETLFVSPDGSVPPGFRSALKASGAEPGCITCNSQNRYGSDLKACADDSAVKLRAKLTPFLKNLDEAEEKHLKDELENHIMWAMVRGLIVEGENHNLGAIVLKHRFWTDQDGTKHPLVVFRAAFTQAPSSTGSCFRSLLECASVRHVVNLYGGDMELDDLIHAEKETAAMFGATYVLTARMDYGQWMAAIRKHPEDGQEKDEATLNLARLIREQILMPGEEPPKGNILIHCGGGMHRTGVVMGILQKVINGDPMDKVGKTYRYHVGYIDENNQGGFEQGNLDFIAGFPAQLLE